MKIALDAMGGDYAPREIVAGAMQAANQLDGVTTIFLVGDETAIRAELARGGSISSKIVIRHASEVIGMDEKPAIAVRRKRDSSIGVAVDLVKSGEADAVLSAGNTGAVVAAATLKLRTLEGVTRPAIATVMPTPTNPFVLIDAGANVEADAKMLCEFAVMGSVYSHAILGREKPVVGLLSIGAEEQKGNDTTRATLSQLKQGNLNFRGNVEGHDLFEGKTDVVVCDGFVGNVVLKTSESVAQAIASWMKREFKSNVIRMLGALLMSGAIRAMKKRLNPELHGGAPLLGVRGTCFITHGSASATAIFHAIRVASESVDHHVNDLIVEQLALMNAAAETSSDAVTQ